MKLYNGIGPNPQAVRIFAAEKGISLEMVPVDLVAGENRRAPYTEVVNRFGQLPALELDDGTVITEIVAICEYLEELHPTPSLIGSQPEERALTRSWVRRIDLNINEIMSIAFKSREGRQMFEGRMKLVSPEAAQDLWAVFEQNLLWLDAEMGDRQFVCGDRFTLADVTLYCNLGLLPMIGRKVPESASWLPDWADRVAARSSASA